MLRADQASPIGHRLTLPGADLPTDLPNPPRLYASGRKLIRRQALAHERSYMHGTWKKALAPALAVAVSALSLSATALPASASGTKPTYIIAYEGPLSGGNAQLGLNMEYSVQLAIKPTPNVDRHAPLYP